MKAAKALLFRVLTLLRLPCGQSFGCLSRFARLSVFRGSSFIDLNRLPAPRISREKFLNLSMMTDGKLPLEAFDEHAVL